MSAVATAKARLLLASAVVVGVTVNVVVDAVVLPISVHCVPEEAATAVVAPASVQFGSPILIVFVCESATGATKVYVIVEVMPKIGLEKVSVPPMLATTAFE